MSRYIFFIFSCILIGNIQSQIFSKKEDSLRGSLTAERQWWKSLYYSIELTPDIENQYIKGIVEITYKVVEKSNSILQIDLQQPMRIDSVFQDGNKLQFERISDNVYHLSKFAEFQIEDKKTVKIYFSGKPKKAIHPPWNGGWVWEKDFKGRPWVSVACQGLGASVWLPCKDHQSDEPNGMTLTMNLPKDLMGVANGRLIRDEIINDKHIVSWRVESPINLYNIIPSIGYYKSFSSTYNGLEGPLDCSFWVLDDHLEKAKQHFQVVDTMLNAFEYWFGPYPFYKDGYKLVETPFLGMEHQSNIAYGNKFMTGYRGRDLSLSGWGLKWDFIIVHESGHEWFGNSITSKDIADMWIHEAFTNYSEVLYVDYVYGKDAGNEYAIGLRHNIKNDKPIIGPYDLNKEGSGDMYYKGSNLLHTIRQLMNDDEKFRQMLIGINKTFYHQTVTSKQVEDFMIEFTGLDLQPIFDQYLRTSDVPKFKSYFENDTFYFRWENCISNFNMPLKLKNGQLIYPIIEWKHISFDLIKNKSDLEPNENFYIKY